MTVSYQYEVASSTSGGFTRLLFMWRGSLYKLIYRELLLFLAAFGVLSALYRNVFSSDQRKIFEKMVMYCDTFINLIPLSFVLGFYVAYVAGRWWQQYMAIPWPDKIMHSIALFVCGNDDHGRMVRRTLMRYLNLTLVLVLRSISSAVKRRFPTLDHVVESGFMTTVELEMFQSVPSTEFNTYWIPCTWFISLLKESKKNKQIEDSQGLHIIMEEFNEFRSKCGLLWSYDWVSIPLVYTQVVTIATYSFFLAALVGRQYVDAAKKPLQMEIDIYLPVFTILQFFFFMGLLKVAEQLINPFGDDDEDFELNWLIDRHTKVSYLGVDLLMASAPPLVKDMYFDQLDITLPYTEASVAYKKKTYRGSVHNMSVPEDKHTMFLPEISEEDEDRTPTPRSSLSTVQSMAHTRASEPASLPAAAAAAGTWRSLHPSTQSINKASEVDPELEDDVAPYHRVEMYVDLDTLHQEQKFREQITSVSSESAETEKGSRVLNRSESAPSKRPVFSGRSMLGWPSSSTLAYSDASFRCSDQSVDVNSGRTPTLDNMNNRNYEVDGEGMRSKRSDSVSSAAMGGHLDCESAASGNAARRSGSSDCGNSRLNVGSEYFCNHSPKASQALTEAQTLNRHNEYWAAKAKETEYVSFDKRFGSSIAKVKSCPKLVFDKQPSANNGKKRGVRWKPMINNISGTERRQTVELVPMSADAYRPNNCFDFTPGSEDPELYNMAASQCRICRKGLDPREATFLQSLRRDSEATNYSEDSASNLSLSQELCPFHYRVNFSASSRTQALPTRRLQIGTEKLQIRNLQERRATVSTLTLTGSELEAKRWQSRSFWERGFFKKMKNIYSRKGIKVIPVIKRDLSLKGRRVMSQSLPNIILPPLYSESKPVNVDPQIPCTKRITPTVRVSDMTSAESEGSSCFASILEMQEEEDSKTNIVPTSLVIDEKNIPKISVNLAVNTADFPSNSSVSNNSVCEFFNARSQESSWQSTDWTGILNVERNPSTPRNDTADKDVHVPTSGESSTCAPNTLQEVVVDNGSHCEKESSKNVS